MIIFWIENFMLVFLNTGNNLLLKITGWPQTWKTRNTRNYLNLEKSGNYWNFEQPWEKM